MDILDDKDPTEQIAAMTKQEAHDALAKWVHINKLSLRWARRIADAHGLQFDIRSAYGMGGTYYGRVLIDAQKERDKANGYEYTDEDWRTPFDDEDMKIDDYEEVFGYWRPSSQSC